MCSSAPHPQPDSAGSPDSASTYRSAPVSFVRRGSRLQGRRQQAWDTWAPTYVLEVARSAADTSVDPSVRLDPEKIFGRKAPLVVEIGSGLGEAVIHAASQHPEINFLAVEVYLPGMAQTLMKAGPQGLSNVRLIQANAPEVLSHVLPEGSVDELWVFFPDPWPKTRHHKRRLVKASLAPLAARVLKDQGTWRLATDWPAYAAQMSEVIGADPEFTNPHHGTPGIVWNEDGERIMGVAPRFDGRTLTSFENKALTAGRTITDFTFTRAPRERSAGE